MSLQVPAPSGRMKAIVCQKLGAPEVALALEEVDRPAVGPHRALVRVHASTVNQDDLQYVRGELSVRPAEARKPTYKIIGSDIAGTVEAVGENVTQVRPGDEVMADLTRFGFGAFAEYVAVPARALAPKPQASSFEEAACLPTAAVRALQGLTCRGRITPGQAILINGAGGGMGTFAIQMAKAFGAEVTGVDATAKLDLMRSLGADHVLDYTKGHYSDSGGKFDLILDVAAYRSLGDFRPVLRSGRVLSAKGRYVLYLVGGSLLGQVFITLLLQSWMKLRGGWKLAIHQGTPNRRTDLARVTELAQSGAIRPVIDQRYPLSQVPEALTYVEQGHVMGKVVITI